MGPEGISGVEYQQISMSTRKQEIKIGDTRYESIAVACICEGIPMATMRNKIKLAKGNPERLKNLLAVNLVTGGKASDGNYKAGEKDGRCVKVKVGDTEYKSFADVAREYHVSEPTVQTYSRKCGNSWELKDKLEHSRRVLVRIGDKVFASRSSIARELGVNPRVLNTAMAEMQRTGKPLVEILADMKKREVPRRKIDLTLFGLKFNRMTDMERVLSIHRMILGGFLDRYGTDEAKLEGAIKRYREKKYRKYEDRVYNGKAYKTIFDMACGEGIPVKELIKKFDAEEVKIDERV